MAAAAWTADSYFRASSRKATGGGLAAACLYENSRVLEQTGSVASRRMFAASLRAFSTLGFQVVSTDKASIDYSNGNMDFYVNYAGSGWDKTMRITKDDVEFVYDFTLSQIEIYSQLAKQRKMSWAV